MPDWKPIARLGLGWALKLAGMALIFDGGTPVRPRSQWISGAEVFGGFVLIILGLWLRRRVVRPRSKS